MKIHEYLLVSLAEECAEVAQRATKALRFGLLEKQPGQTLDNAIRLVDELDDLALIVDLLRSAGAIPSSSSDLEAKRAKIFKYMDFAEECGTLDQEFHRASGDVVSGMNGISFLHRLCNGLLVKL